VDTKFVFSFISNKAPFSSYFGLFVSITGKTFFIASKNSSFFISNFSKSFGFGNSGNSLALKLVSLYIEVS